MVGGQTRVIPIGCPAALYDVNSEIDETGGLLKPVALFDRSQLSEDNPIYEGKGVVEGFAIPSTPKTTESVVEMCTKMITFTREEIEKLRMIPPIKMSARMIRACQVIRYICMRARG